ncbi:restriction endonuclease PLD domain-containing protein [Bacillus altitudinis]|uniref:restriction endonuclease PLD domain-containing protein n=1 Tax=Bacillus altitudinis TaxID=293387 RepID=UPI0015BEF99A|nr:restriction endonuclease PLD domain-containing protein [Bacillus altitudinis]
MYLIDNLEERVFRVPYERGYRKLRILSGYASSAFLYHILNRYPEIEIELIIGMSKQDGIRRWDHERYQQIMNENPRISISYKTSLPPVHNKIYHWHNGGLFQDSITYVGSANFSWGGFRDQTELIVEANHDNIEEVFDVPDCLSCTDPTIEQHIRFHDMFIRRTIRNHERIVTIQQNTYGSDRRDYRHLHHLPYVDLPLLLNNDTAIHERSGLNWGQREGRERNQAYIPVSSTIHAADPDFFPPLEQEFTIVTDDGERLMCVMAQANRKAIHTHENNSLMGRYFRNRIGVPFGGRVDAQDVIAYGRTSVRVYKIDNETYFMDFGV